MTRDDNKCLQHKGSVASLAVSFDGTRLYSTAVDGTLALHDVQVCVVHSGLDSRQCISQAEGGTLVRVCPTVCREHPSPLDVNERGTWVAFAGPLPHTLSLLTALTFDPVCRILSSNHDNQLL